MFAFSMLHSGLKGKKNGGEKAKKANKHLLGDKIVQSAFISRI